MKRLLLLPIVFVLILCVANAQTYNNMWIPDTLSGTSFKLTIKDTFKQMITTGNQTITGGINSDFWGPTLFVNKGDSVHMTVINKLNDSTTLHWHGMHLPAVMDGGPHQIIPPGTTWSPYWKMTNDAGTYWFHPHLHETTEEQITKGIGGLLIVRDAVESALALPRTYGVDDIPLILTDRSFSSNQFTVVPYGDSMITNGTLRAQYSVPAQVVRFRVLNAAIERSYNLGLSDGSSFYVIATDGGLVDKPVAVTRYLISPGERVEILVNLTAKTVGASLFLKAYNSTIDTKIGGGENFPGGPFANALGRKDFNILKINVIAQKSNAITTIPTALRTNTFPSSSAANITRTLTFTDSTGVTSVPILGPNAFIIEHKLFDYNYVNHSVPLNNTEIWELKSTSGFAHPFHIHDVEFYILSRNGVAVSDYEKGWKDVVLVKSKETVKFIAKFDDFADGVHPFMYHCHISLHEDEGMMGQFVVTSTLPVTLTSFAAKLAENKVNLNWASEQEVSIDNYEVERSFDGKNFQSIGIVKYNLLLKGNYSFIDNNSVTSKDRTSAFIYYRLKINETSSKVSYSSIKTINIGLLANHFDFSVYPNPAKDKVFVQFDSPLSSAYYAWVYNSAGRAVYMMPVPELSSGIATSNLPKGTYYLTIMDKENKETVTKKFIKE